MRFSILCLVLLPHLASAQEGVWKKHVIQSPVKDRINSAVAHDWDGDGKMDVMASHSGKVVLYRAPKWEPHTVFTFRKGLAKRNPRGQCIHSCLLDADHDGDPDFIGSNLTVFWLETPEDPFNGKEWVYRTVDDEILGTHCLVTGDVDLDGTDDLVANSFRTDKSLPHPNSIAWLEIPKKSQPLVNWPRHIFADRDAPGCSHYMGIGDVNGDGLPDIACGAKGGGNWKDGEWFAWWEQPKDGAKGVWKKHLLATGQVGASNILPADFDGDGHVDYFATRGHGKGGVFFAGPDFRPVDLGSDLAFPHSLALADVDGDGDSDALTCGKEADGKLVWFENLGKRKFKERVLAENQGAYDLRTPDMDGDGDPDILIAGHASCNVVWFENPRKGKK